MSRQMVDSPWADEAKIDRLRELWAEGHSTAEIGRRLGVSKNSVVSKAHRLKLPSRPSPVQKLGPHKPKPALSKKRYWSLPAKALPVPPSIAAAMAEEKATERRVVAQLSALACAAVEPEPEAPRVAFKPPAPRQCCWPMWNGKPTHQYCEAEAVLGKPYCAPHRQIAYTSPAPERADLAPWLPNRQGVAGTGGVGFV